MTDYIKREDAISTMYTFLKQAHDMDNNNDRLAEVLTIAKNVVHEIPSADVAPVRHGRWYQDAIYYGEDGSPCIVDICTECGAYGYYADFNYCPNCGAKMYKENDND